MMYCFLFGTCVYCARVLLVVVMDLHPVVVIMLESCDAVTDATKAVERFRIFRCPSNPWHAIHTFKRRPELAAATRERAAPATSSSRRHAAAVVAALDAEPIVRFALRGHVRAVRTARTGARDAACNEPRCLVFAGASVVAR